MAKPSVSSTRMMIATRRIESRLLRAICSITWVRPTAALLPRLLGRRRRLSLRGGRRLLCRHRRLLLHLHLRSLHAEVDLGEQILN